MFRCCKPLLVLMFIVLLSSCSTKKNDGPPDFYVDETKIPNATPKPEPLAKYGNYKSYVVFGKRYYTLSSSKNYDEVGTASWYGTKFHAHKTSSGEPYSILGMTAAHKTLPLPTYVEVTNLKNNRRIIVKVNDRGPFESNRIIDLSYVAAKKLGMLGHGTARVRVRALNPFAPHHTEPFFADSRPAKKSHVASIRNKPMYLQVGAFRSKHRAVQLQQRLSAALALPVKIYSPAASGNLYRVKMGPFNAVAMEDITERLKKLGIKPKH
jgi:rare lipoprotein A